MKDRIITEEQQCKYYDYCWTYRSLGLEPKQSIKEYFNVPIDAELNFQPWDNSLRVIINLRTIV